MTAWEITELDDAGLARVLAGAEDRARRAAVVTEIVRRYDARVCRHCRKRLGPDDAELAAADTFAAVWKEVEKGTVPDNVEAFVIGIANNRVKEQEGKRAERARREAGLGEQWELWRRQEEERKRAEDDREFGLRHRLVRELVDNIVGTQPPARRRLHELHFRKGLTGAALAEELGCSTRRANKAVEGHQEWVTRAFRSNALARDPHRRDACGRLARILAEAARKDEDLRTILKDGRSTLALTAALCETVTRHAAHCGTCGANGQRAVARWTRALVPLLFLPAAVEEGTRTDVEPVSCSSRPDGSDTGPAGRPGGPRAARRPPWRRTLLRNATALAAGAALLWGALTLDDAGGTGDAPPAPLGPAVVTPPSPTPSAPPTVGSPDGMPPQPVPPKPKPKPSGSTAPPVTPPMNRPSPDAARDAAPAPPTPVRPRPVEPSRPATPPASPEAAAGPVPKPTPTPKPSPEPSKPTPKPKPPPEPAPHDGEEIVPKPPPNPGPGKDDSGKSKPKPKPVPHQDAAPKPPPKPPQKPAEPNKPAPEKVAPQPQKPVQPQKPKLS
ncbi:RNA polymerase sigma factor [Streptomyces caatingaensis]|uniref:RNA polymerase sigma factor n=1 Tax=Streptomyces caatingaensis TaxID=1678637 RepID=UPI00067277CB|nr:sigma-70 family RNA polymerase sigma factor [Streptomyces caatingaensis]